MANLSLIQQLHENGIEFKVEDVHGLIEQQAEVDLALLKARADLYRIRVREWTKTALILGLVLVLLVVVVSLVAGKIDIKEAVVASLITNVITSVITVLVSYLTNITPANFGDHSPKKEPSGANNVPPAAPNGSSHK